MKGVVLAGGKGTRLGELTKVTNKHLLPVGPWPMVYYPIKKLVGAGITDICLVSGTEHMGDFVELLGSGRELGCSLTYRVQDEAGGIAQALGLCEGFCRGEECVVVLGDNIFEEKIELDYDGGMLFGGNTHINLKAVDEPCRFGVAEIVGGKVVSIEEKPGFPRSEYAVTGVYSFPSDVFRRIRKLKPSARGELEITDVNGYYLREDRLRYSIMQGYWTDAGTPESYAEANRLVRETPPRF